MTVAIVTDSAADLPPSLALSLGIHVIPLTVTLGDETFRDGEDLTPEAFWARAGAPGAPFPTTASPPPEAFAIAYRRAAEAGASAVVSVHLSGALSRTLESAGAAASMASIPVTVVDTGAVSLGEGLVALAAARTARQGAPAEDVVRAANDAPARLRLFAMVDGVEWLRRGGRLGKTRAALGGMLHIRPVLTLAGGEPTLVAKGRTRARAIAEVLERTAGAAEAAGVIHSGAPETGEVTARVREATGLEPITVLVGAVIGTHLGPGALGVAVLGEANAPQSGERAAGAE